MLTCDTISVDTWRSGDRRPDSARPLGLGILPLPLQQATHQHYAGSGDTEHTPPWTNRRNHIFPAATTALPTLIMHILVIVGALALAIRTLVGWDGPVSKNRILPTQRARTLTIVTIALIKVLAVINYEPGLNMEVGAAFLYLVVFTVLGVCLSIRRPGDCASTDRAENE